MSVLARLGKIIRSNIPEFKQKNSPHRERKFRESAQGSSGAANNSREYPDENIAGYYANLELSYGAGLPEIESAWKRLLKKYHPDLHSNDPQKQKTAHHLVQGLNKAHAELVKYLNNQ